MADDADDLLLLDLRSWTSCIWIRRSGSWSCVLL